MCDAGADDIFAPPASPPPDSTVGSELHYIVIGIILCLLSVGLITLGTNVQRYGLVVAQRRRCAIWGGGWGIYLAGLGLYNPAIILAPATLCSALLATVVVWNVLISRVLFKQIIETCDIHGGVLIMAGVFLTNWFGPQASSVYSAADLDDLFLYPGGVAFLAVTLGVTLVLALLVLANERADRLSGVAAKYAHKDDVAAADAGGAASSSDGSAQTGSHKKKKAENGASHLVPAATHAAALHASNLELESAAGTQGSPAAAPAAKASAGWRAALMPFAYPMVVGAIESLGTLCMAPSARMIYSQAAGVNQLCYAVFYLVPIAGVCCFLAQVWWLRKALLHLEVSRQLPVEYGTVSTISVLGFLIFFREGQYVTAEQGAAIAGGIALIVLGCGLIGSRRTPVPQLHCWLRVRRLSGGDPPGDVRVSGGNDPVV